ncbi:MAG: hypothetical protein MJE63_12280 [Proteobacteria bacterium]|nr:hypothetical protein [Pseudomonadota bacterium]
MKPKTIKQLSVFIENRKGELADATSILFEEALSIKSLLLLDSSDFGILRLIVEKPEEAKEVFASAGYTVRINDVFAVKVEEGIGKFHKVAKVLSQHEIDVLYTYAFRNEKGGVFVFKVDNADMERAMDALEEEHLEIVDSSFFY